MLTIADVKIEGFRGLPKSIDLTFGCPVTLLLSENHQGKSSIMNAIEWNLFGDDCVGADTGLRERIGWEVVNRGCEVARVELRLVEENRIWCVVRSQKRIGGKKTQSLVLARPNGTRVEGREAGRELTSLIQLNYRDFFCTAYQHQEAVRGVLVQEPRDRNDAIDRLLGLSDYRNIVDALRQAKLTDLQKSMSNLLLAFQGEVEAALRERRKDLEAIKGEGTKHSLTEAHFNEAEAVSRAKAVAKEIEGLAAEMTLPPPVIGEIAKWPQVKPFCAAAEATLGTLLRQAPEIKAQQELLSDRDRILRVKVPCEGALKEVEFVRSKIRDFTASAGIRSAIETRIAAETDNLAKLDEQIRLTIPKAKLVEEGITLLESSGLGTGRELCPLCGHEVENLLMHLRNEWEQRLQQQVAGLQTTHKQREEELRGWVERLKHLSDLERERDRVQGSLTQAFAATANVLGCVVSASDDPIAVCNQRINAIDEKIDKVNAALTSRQQRFEQVRARLAAVLAIFDVLSLQARLETLGAIFKSEEYKKVDQLRDEMATLVADVDAIQIAVRDASTEAAKLKITAAQRAVKEYFVAMVANPALQDVKLTVEQKVNGNDYHVLDSSGKELTPILSQGDLNCLALAMFFGLADARGGSKGLSVMMLDDPSQSLGEGHLRRLVEVLNQITISRPTILATMDPAFGQMLKQGLAKAKAIYELRNWTPERGPEYTGGGALAGLAA